MICKRRAFLATSSGLTLAAVLMGLPAGIATAQVTGPPGGGGGSAPQGQASPSLTGPTTPKAFQTQDALGVDLASGDIQYSKPLVAIGAANTVNLTATYTNFPGTDENTGAITYSGDPSLAVMTYTVSLGNSSEHFNDSLVAVQGTGSTLVFDSATNCYIYTKNDGTVAIYDLSMANKLQIPSDRGVLTSVTYPNGERLTYYYRTLSGPSGTYVRLRSVVSNRGLMLKYTGEPTVSGGLTVTAVNLAVSYCDPNADTCPSGGAAWPSAQMPQPVTANWSSGGTNYYTITRSVVNSAGKTSSRVYNQATTSYNSQLKKVFNVQITNEVNNPRTYNYYDVWTNSLSPQWSEGKIASASFGSTLSRNYTWQAGGPINKPYMSGGTSTAAEANGDTFSMTFGRSSQQKYGEVAPSSKTVLGNVVSYVRDTSSRITEIVYAEGNRELFEYDSRGNITKQTIRAKVGSGIADVVLRATYPISCSNPKICNKPTSTFDAKNNETLYSWDAASGQLAIKTEPADGNGIKPQTRYTYTALYAQVKNSLGSVVNADTPIYMLTSVSTCATQNSCAGTGDERITSYAYSSNLYPTTVTASGAGLSVSTTTTYTNLGDVAAVDGPRTDVDDTIYKTYDIMRRPIFEISADPDGGGALKRTITRHVYDDAGQEIRTESGEGQATDGSDFVRKSFVANSFNNSGLKVREAAYADGNGTPTVVTDYAYDSSGRQVCSTVRMNPAAFGSLPADACTLSVSGTWGPDRVTKSVYNSGSQLTEIIRAFGVTTTNGFPQTLQQSYARYTYTNNGLKASEKDANGNLTTLEYDGLDRSKKLRFPSTTVGAGTSSTTDYEEFGYDANSNRISWRRRDGNIINYTYDNLNHETVRDIPGGTSKDVYIGYDALGRITYKRFGSTGGAGVGYNYDGLGRISTTSDMNGRTVGYSYNQAAAKVSVIHPDLNTVGYGLDSRNRMTSVGWNATTGLLTQGYDNLGRILGVGKVGGSTSYGYDGVGRLAAMTNDFAGSGYDVTWGFSFNPANQIASFSANSTVFDYKELSTATNNKTFDGLNRDAGIVSVGGYDARGNLTYEGSGGRTLTYDLENRLLSVSSPSANVVLDYDPEERLYRYSNDGGGSWTTYLYDGVNLIGEYTGSSTTPLRRYIHGTGSDDPMVWFEGPAASDKRWLYTNYQGSVIAYTGEAGNPGTIFRYGPYGEPKDINNNENWASLRFRYTGQVTLPEAKLYYYKARVYDPAYGRFLQTDPIGSANDINLYAYVGGDPINMIDPSGLTACPTGDKNCVDDPNSEKNQEQCPGGCPVTPSQDATTAVVITGKRGGKIGNDRIDYTVEYPTEQYGRVDGDQMTGVQGKQERKYECSDGTSGASNVLNKADFAGADAAAHTHPDWANSGPGPDDGSIPGQLGISNYIISRSGIIAVEKTPVGFRARLVQGSWGDTSPADVRATVQGYNKGNGSGNSGKSCTYQ